MGKLIETLQRVRKPGAGTIGFLGRGAQPPSKPKAAGILVALDQPDAGQVEAVKKAGADAVIFAAQNGRGGKAMTVEPYFEAAAALRAANLPWGLDLAGVVSSLNADAFKTLREGGVDFISFPFSAPARLLQERPEGLDRIVTLESRLFDIEKESNLLTLRSVNLLSVQGVRLEAGFSADFLHNLTIEDLLRYRMLRESLRFPAFVSVEETLGQEEVRTLVKLGTSAVVAQQAAGESASAFVERIAALREELERVPMQEREEDEDVPRVGLPTPATTIRREPEPEPVEPDEDEG